MEEIDNL